ncbi:MAG TPA: DNA-3-methyladenine glycosylase [Methylomirabilota bacterium]|nr:DNA-3-methyladenine glycosylase [Methylomirabilota bacterium]
MLPPAFYQRPAPDVARDLLGCTLVSRLGRTTTAGRIVETEAYLGPEDGASHAAFRPGSHGLLYGAGGVAYVFSAYGLHACLNAIAGPPGTPGCVLIRALEPVAGLAAMARRRGLPPGRHASPRELRALTSGPARLTQALGITLRENGADLGRGALTIHAPRPPAPVDVASGRRIGITRATELPLRFWVRGNPFVSRGPAGPRTRRGMPGPQREARRARPRARWRTGASRAESPGRTARLRALPDGRRPGPRGRPQPRSARAAGGPARAAAPSRGDGRRRPEAV